MNHQTVYIVCCESLYDGDYDTKIRVFSTKEKAKKVFDSIVKEEKKNDHLLGREDIVIEDCNSFSIYPDGEYSEDHCTVWISEKEIE